MGAAWRRRHAHQLERPGPGCRGTVEHAYSPGPLLLLRSLVRHWRQDDYLFVHAGIRPGTTLAEQNPDDFLWIREGFLDWKGVMLPEAPETLIVHGHTIRPRPVIRPNRIGLDTGAGIGGPLSCAVLEGQGVRWLKV